MKKKSWLVPLAVPWLLLDSCVSSVSIVRRNGRRFGLRKIGKLKRCPSTGKKDPKRRQRDDLPTWLRDTGWKEGLSACRHTKWEPSRVRLDPSHGFVFQQWRLLKWLAKEWLAKSL